MACPVTAWLLAPTLYKFLVNIDSDPQAGRKKMMEKLTPVVVMFIVTIFTVMYVTLSVL